LSLASALSGRSHVDVTVADPRDVDFKTPAEAAEILLAADPDVVGFSTMCNTYPHALRIAQIVEERRPDTAIVFGGPHATHVAYATLSSFPFIDFILRGECERSVVDLVRLLTESGSDPSRVPGLVYRAGGLVRQGAQSYPLLAPEELPDIDYGVLPRLQEFRDIPLDVGRGCPFACTFCSTNSYWGRRYRLRDAADIVRTVQRLQQVHGLHAFRFVHDNFTAARGLAMQFCNRIIEAGIDCEWRCSGRPDSMDDELVSVMARAGCRSVFVGVESGSRRVQELSRKRVSVARALPAIRTLASHDVQVTASFIAGFPYEEELDLEQTLRLMSTIHHETRARTHLQIHLLMPVPAAPLHDEPGVRLEHDATSAPSENASFDATMREWICLLGPPMFCSFYHYRTPAIARGKLVSARLGWQTVFTHLPLTGIALEEARRRDRIRLLDVFGETVPDGWDHPEVVTWCVNALRSYLSATRFRWTAAVLAVLEFEAAVVRQRTAGGVRYVDSSHAVLAWAERAAECTGPIGLPDQKRCCYVMTGRGSGLTVTRVAPASPSDGLRRSSRIQPNCARCSTIP
jgi:radical SAM superfamily enzyme YgiQ (UPF0313 family)